MNQEEFDSVLASLKADSQAYYTDGTPTVSDAEYDRTLKRLQAAVEEHPEWDDGSLSKVAEGAVGGDVEHLTPMLSLNKVYSRDKLKNWWDRLGKPTLSPELKYDGAGISLFVENGRLKKIATRGDGYVGEDITSTAKGPLNLGSVDWDSHQPPRGHMEVGWDSNQPPRGQMEIRGEAIIPAHVFESLRGEYSNARNACAGILRGGHVLENIVDFIAYDITGSEDPDYVGDMNYLHQLGFTTSYVGHVVSEWSGIEDFLNDPFSYVNHDSNFYEYDGIVFKAVDMSLRDRVGSTSKFPRWSIAYKFDDEDEAARDTTTLVNIKWQPGRTGKITPVAEVEPVTVDGAEITFASLHNPGFIKEQGLEVGDTVQIYRAGKVIPRVLGLHNPPKDVEVEYPTDCPNCGQPTVYEPAGLMCSQGIRCNAVENLSYTVSRPILNIDGLGKKNIRKLVEGGVLSDLPSLFRLPDLTDEQWEDCGVPLTYKGTAIKELIQQAKSREPYRFLASLGIELIGENTSKEVMKKIPDLLVSPVDVVEIEEVLGRGRKSGSLVQGLLDNHSILDELKELGCNLQGSAESGGTESLGGLKFVITGSFEEKTRPQIQEEIEKRGGKVSSSVSKSTDYLVAGNKAGSKLEKAQNLGVNVIDLGQLEDLQHSEYKEQ